MMEALIKYNVRIDVIPKISQDVLFLVVLQTIWCACT